MELLETLPQSRWARTKLLFKQTFNEWSEDKAPKLAASLAFYTMLALAPLLVLVTGIAGLVFGDEAARGQIVSQFKDLLGAEGAAAVQTMIQNASRGGGDVMATIIGGVLLLIGATAVFVELQDSMNAVWNVKPKASGLKGLLRGRLVSFTMIVGVGFLLLVSLLISAVLSGVSAYMSDALPGTDWIWQVANIVVSFGIVTVLFAMIFKILPDANVRWSEVWVGAAFTAVLFTIGKFLIGLYLGQSSTVSVYGAAGSLAIVLIWVYYAAQILFFGAEFTQVHSRLHGKRITPKQNAVVVDHAAKPPAPVASSSS